MKRLIELNDLMLKPQTKLVIGYTSSVIYDFEKKKSYQISRLAGDFLEKVFGNKRIQNRKVAFDRWIEKKNKLSGHALEELFRFVDQLKKIGVLVPISEKEKGEIEVFNLETAFPIPNSPVFSILECTSRCNFHCPHCYLGKKNPAQDLNLDIIYSLLIQLQEMKVRSVLLTGGEICLRDDLKEIITFAYRLGLKIEMSTNGSLLSRWIDVVDKYVDKIQITLYGFSKETYLRFSNNPNTLNEVISVIEEIRKKNPETLLLTFTLTPYNYQDVVYFLRFVREKNIKHKIGRTLPIGLALKDKNLLPNSCYSLFISRFEKKYLKENSFPFRTRVCPLDRITVLSNGKVTICPLSRTPKLIFGDIYHRTLKEIWYEKMRPSFASFSVDNLEICKDCEFKYLCGGGCPALWYILEPLKRAKTPPCESPFFTKRYILKNIEN